MDITRRFKAVDYFYIALTVAPIVAGMVLHILTAPASDSIRIVGARIYATIPMPIQDLVITEAQIHSWLVMLSLCGASLYLTHGLHIRNVRIRQHIAEWLVERTDAFVRNSMGAHFAGFTPFVMAIIALSAGSSLLALVGLFPPTSDLNVVGGWAVLVFILITYYKWQGGWRQYIKSFTKPVAILTPINLISEVATPISMAFRHYGNILSGSVIAVLVTFGLQHLSKTVFGWLPAFWGDIPFLQVGIPAILSLYFDVFSGCLQAYIFAVLTMMYIANEYTPIHQTKETQIC